jgi:iron complex outermembrane receptor protein
VVPDKFTLTAGIKVEHNDFTNFEFQPSVRMTFKPTAQQTLWAAVSRAVRTPSETEGRDMFTALAGPPFVGPGGGLYVPTLVGDAHPVAEVLWAYEMGYRFQPGRRVNVDLAAFYNDYTNLISVSGVNQFIPGVPFGEAMTPFSNIFKGQTYGGEASATFSPADGWKVTAGSSPKSQVSLRSAYDFTKRASFDAQLRYVSAIQFVPAYLTADVRLSYRPTHQLELALVGQNLFDPQHPEQPTQPTTVTTEVPRGFFGEITWRF